ncbi:hypothetical protein M9Y10_045699 [Tritrichomonas musculus]|uniref:Uncharacterized protein n=1 Tax=Tritrichomonas musculus TaxID=1915356 RepID=A0ABR2JWB7_9EUKA
MLPKLITLDFLKLIPDWRMIDDKEKELEKNDEIASIANSFFDKDFLDQFENDSNFMNMFEAIVLMEIESIDDFINIFCINDLFQFFFDPTFHSVFLKTTQKV